MRCPPRMPSGRLLMAVPLEGEDGQVNRGARGRLPDAEPGRGAAHLGRRRGPAAARTGRSSRPRLRLLHGVGDHAPHRQARPRREGVEPRRLLRHRQGPLQGRARPAQPRAQPDGGRPREPAPGARGARDARGPQPLRPRPARLRKAAGLRHLAPDRRGPRPDPEGHRLGRVPPRARPTSWSARPRRS